MANSKHEPNRQKRVAPSQTAPPPLLLPAMRREAGREREQIEKRERTEKGGKKAPKTLVNL